jgi:hypothetical protein
MNLFDLKEKPTCSVKYIIAVGEVQQAGGCCRVVGCNHALGHLHLVDLLSEDETVVLRLLDLPRQHFTALEILVRGLLQLAAFLGGLLRPLLQLLAHVLCLQDLLLHGCLSVLHAGQRLLRLLLHLLQLRVQLVTLTQLHFRGLEVRHRFVEQLLQLVDARLRVLQLLLHFAQSSDQR